MSRKLSTLILIWLFNFSSFFAQTKHTLSGYVKDQKTGEQLIGAALVVKEIPATGATTNAYGFYSITIPEGKYTVVILPTRKWAWINWMYSR